MASHCSTVDYLCRGQTTLFDDNNYTLYAEQWMWKDGVKYAFRSSRAKFYQFFHPLKPGSNFHWSTLNYCGFENCYYVHFAKRRG
jgi:hypothetical protein